MASSALADVCSSPAFTGPAAAQQFVAAARGARVLSLLSPIPGAQANGSCVEALAEAAAGAAAEHGACGCRQVASWLLACVGFALPLAAQFLVEAAARRRFLRRRARRDRSEGRHACWGFRMGGRRALHGCDAAQVRHAAAQRPSPAAASTHDIHLAPPHSTRRHCRGPCDSCSIAKGADVWTLGGTAALLLASFSGVAWQLVSLAFPAA